MGARARRTPADGSMVARPPASSVIVELPIAPNSELWRECDSLFDSIYHQKRRVNGYSGFFPKAHEWVRVEYQQHGLSATLLNYFARIGAGYLILPAGSAEQARGRGLREVWQGDGRVNLHPGRGFVSVAPRASARQQAMTTRCRFGTTRSRGPKTPR